MRDITVCIPTYENSEWLQRCLQTLYSYGGFDGEVVVVDNKGDVGTEHSVNVMRMGKNIGWMESVNIVGMECDTELFCAMNDDVCMVPGTQIWDTLSRWFEVEEVGAVGPATNAVTNHSQCLWEPNPSSILEVEWLAGFFVMYRTEAFQRVGGLDDELLFGDDFDMGAKLNREGYKVIADRRLYVHHHGGVTTGRVGGARPARAGDKDHKDLLDVKWGERDRAYMNILPVGEAAV